MPQSKIQGGSKPSWRYLPHIKDVVGRELNSPCRPMIEFETQPSNLDKFVDVLDSSLCSLNSDYEAKRYKNITLKRPLVNSLQPGTFYKWMQKRGKLGGQNKIPRLSNDRKYLDELADILTQ